MVLPASLSLLIALMVVPTAFVAAAGALVGWGAAARFKTNFNAIVFDAAFACVAFWVVFFGALAVPWHGTYVEDGWTLSGTVPYPHVWALGVATLVPIAHEYYRHWRVRSRS